jgi:hypothetical protein
LKLVPPKFIREKYDQAMYFLAYALSGMKLFIVDANNTINSSHIGNQTSTIRRGRPFLINIIIFDGRNYSNMGQLLERDDRFK